MRLDKRDHKSLVLWATDCAEHVLPYFEEKYQKDNRPRKAVEAGRAWVRGEIALSEARAAAVAAHAAARAAGHSVATAQVAGHAGHAATYAVTYAAVPGGRPSDDVASFVPLGVVADLPATARAASSAMSLLFAWLRHDNECRGGGARKMADAVHESFDVMTRNQYPIAAPARGNATSSIRTLQLRGTKSGTDLQVGVQARSMSTPS